MTMPTFADGKLINAATLNVLPTGLNALSTLMTGAVAPRLYIPTVGASVTTTHAIASATDTTVRFDTAGINNDTMWVSGTTQLTVHTAGNYIAWAQVTFDANVTGLRALHILLNGTSVTSNVVAGASDNALTVAGSVSQLMCRTPPMVLAVNATLFLSVFQNSGSSVSVDSIVSGTFLCVTRIGK
jgi:hypothetical protein